MRQRINLLLLIAANLFPLAGVLLLDRGVGALVVLYWSENLVLGFYNILKMVSVKGILAVFPALFFILTACLLRNRAEYFFLASFFVQPSAFIAC